MQEEKSYFPVENEFSYCPRMKPWIQPDPVRNLIIDKAEQIGETLKSLSEKLGKNHAYLQQFVQRGTPRVLPEEIRIHLAELLGVDQRSLRGPFKEAPSERLPPSLLAKRPASEIQRERPATLLTQRSPPSAARANEVMHETIPLLGQGVAGRDGSFPFNGERVADIPAPPSIARIRDAYAIYVVGTSMLPRYEPGEIVFVDPTKPAMRGDYVVVQISEGGDDVASAGYIKQYVSMDEKQIKLLELHPKRKQLTFPTARVVAVHVIVLAGKT